MRRSNSLAWIIGAIVLSVLFLTVIFAPFANQINSGSTYGRGASGYGAWYAYMQKQGISIKRWKQPFPDILEQKNPSTFIRVNSKLRTVTLSPSQEKFVRSGNTLVILGVREPVSTTKFSTMQNSDVGDIKIDTGRRKESLDPTKIRLGDEFGAVVWGEKYGKGKVVFATTPHIAANAYQDNLPNYRFLKDLVTKDNKSLFIDEYIHGYVDRNPQNSGRNVYRDSKESLWSYLSKTPIAIAFVQALVFLAVLVIFDNRIMGQLKSVTIPTTDNNKAYIQALSAVLYRATSHNYVIETIATYEEKQLRRKLGIVASSDTTNSLNSQEEILCAWKSQIGAVPQELTSVLTIHRKKHIASEKDLINWLQNWQTLKQILASKKNK